MLKKSLTGLVASVAFGAMTLGASAADLEVSDTAVQDWTGPYIGALVGIGSFDASARVFGSGPDSITASFSDSGVMGGLTVGWNVQDGHIVYGIEGDVSFGDVDDTLSNVGFFTQADLTASTDLFATVRGRVGVTASDILLYTTFGLAILDGDVSSSAGGSSSFTALGGVVGAGAELAINRDVSVKAEILYAIFDEDIGIGDLGGFNPGDNVNIDEFYTVRIGVNWHF